MLDDGEDGDEYSELDVSMLDEKESERCIIAA